MRPKRDTARPDRIGRDGKLGGPPDRRHPHRFSDEGYRASNLPVLVTCVARNEAPVLTGSAAERVIEALVATAQRFGMAVHVYCVMPDHIHAVVTGSAQGGDFPGFMRAFKSTSSRWVNRVLGLTNRPGRFGWQRSYWDTFARDGEVLEAQIQYLLENPVHEGLCGHPEEWPYAALISYPE